MLVYLWILGFLFGYWGGKCQVASRCHDTKPHKIIAGASMAIVFVTLTAAAANILKWVSFFTFPRGVPAQPVIVLFLTFATLAGIILMELSTPKKRFFWDAFKASAPAIIVFLLAAMIPLLSATIVYPVFGWDALSYWMPVTIEGSLAEGGSIQVTERIRTAHPALLPALISLSLDQGSSGDSNSISTLYALGALTAVITLYGFSRVLGFSSLGSLIWCLLLLSVPLYVNHILIVGYSEAWVCLFIFQSTVVIFIYGQRKSKRLIFSAICLFVAVIFLRNTGIINLVAFMAALQIALFSCRKRLLFPLGVLVVLVFCAGLGGGALSFGGVKFGFVADPLRLIIAGYSLPVAAPEIDTFLSITHQSLFLNISFSTAVLAIITCLIIMLRATNKSITFSYALLAAVPVCQICVAFLSLFTAYGVSHALPSNDTGFSRQLLVGIISAIPLIIYSCRIVSAETKST